ncbi:MAG TPA: TonB-dependent receptor [Acidobacteriaceae bacterium]
MKQDLSRARKLGRQMALLLASATRTGIVLAGIAMLTSAGHAQYRASLRGTVTDPSGAVVPNATVTLTDTGTNQVMTATSDANGIYTFNGLPPDHFSVKAEAQGFQTTNVAEVVLIPEQPNALNIKMQVGGTTQQVIVSGSQAPLLDTDTATVSQTISSNQIEHLPSYNRDVFQLAQLAPGVFGDGAQGGGGGTNNNPGNQGPGGSGNSAAGIFQTENGPQIQARGGQYETNGISIDGISTVSAVWGGTSIITPSEDSVANVKVVSNSYDAESGRFSGGQIQVTSKSGTNNFHGSLFFKASRPGLNAYQRWNGTGSNHAGSASDRGVNRDESRFNNYGGSVGGPIWKNKVFFFFNYETSPFSSSATSQGWYETPQFLASAASSGSISSKYTTYKGEGVAANGLIRRTCGDIGLVEGVQCRTTPQGLDVGSPLKIGLGKQDPTYGGSASAPGIGGGLDGIPDIAFFNTVNPTTVSQAQYNGRMDADVTSKDHISFAIYWVPSTTTDFNGPVRSANFWHHEQVNDAFSVIWNHTFSPTLLNQARANAAGWRWNEVVTNPQAPFGLPQDNIGNVNDSSCGGSACAFGTASFQFLGAPGPSNLNQWTYDYNDVLTKIAGRHSIKVGGDLTRLYYLNNPVYAARPTFTFRNLWDFANDAPYSETGQFDAATGVPFANRQDDRVSIWGVFVQDDYKVRPNLTINAGLRWSYFGAFYSKQDNLDVLRSLNNLAALNIRVGGHLYAPQKTDFGPQLGFAWQPIQSDGKLVLRGGFGINYNQNEIAITANGNGNPPNAVQANFCCATPTSAVPGIVYATATSINSIFGYAPNPATITHFGPNNLPTNGQPINVTGFESNPNTISNYHYSLDAQYQLPYDLVATVGYQGSQSRHLFVQSNYNVIAAYHGMALSPFANNIDYWANSGSGNYNGLITTLRHNFSHTFQVEAQYAWTKAMDENSGPYFEDPYPYDSHLAYGRSDYNVANAFKVFGLWQPILFRGSHGWLEKVAGGWTVSGIFNVHSGFPFTPLYQATTSGGVYYNGSGYGQLRPSAAVAGFGKKTDNKSFEQSINPNFGADATKYFIGPRFADGPAFPAVSPLPQPGIQRNSLNGPGYQDLDGSLTKAFGLPKMPVLGESARVEFRADAYNLFNKTNLDVSSINTTVGSVSPDGTVSPNSSFGVAGKALGSRTVQLQARFSF